jgi:hypothetical protein
MTVVDGRRDLSMKDHVLAWHFVGATLRDGRPIPPDGEWKKR